MNLTESDIKIIFEDLGFRFESVDEIYDGSDKLFQVNEESSKSLVVKFRDFKQLELSWFKKEPLMIEEIRDKTSLPVPNILYYDMSEEEYPPFFIMDFIEKETLAEKNEAESSESIEELHFEAGAYLGQLHSETSYDNSGRIVYREDNLKVKDQEWKDLFESMAFDRLEKLNETEFSKYTEDAKQYFEENLSVISDVENFVLCHDDFRPGNILVNNGKINTIIDWARAFAGDPLYDLINAGYHFDNEEKDQIPNQEFLKGYRISTSLEIDKGRKQVYLLNNIIGQMIGFSTVWKNNHTPEEQNKIANKLSKDLENIINSKK